MVEAAGVVEAAHLEVLRQFPEAELVGFHGQTLAHEPGGRGTHQTGSGARLATELGLPVAWDFRSADVAAGGQGAPLAPFFHHALARYVGATAPLAFLNLGGVGNITWVDPAIEAPEAPGALVAFDTGPANAPVNDLLHTRRGLTHDAGGALALQGTPDETVLARFGQHPYFARAAPKSLDRDAFSDLAAAVAGLSDEDAAATLTQAAARAVALGLGHLPARPQRVLVAGGGRHNAALMAALRAELAPATVEPVEAAGLDGDMLEAHAFAYLAERVARGLPLSAPGTTGVPRPMPGGQLSHPASS